MENKASLYVESFKDATIKLKVLVSIILFFLVYALSSTELYYAGLTPFGISVVFALFSVGFSGYLLAGEFFIAYILSNITLSSILVALVVSLVLCLSEFLRMKLKSKSKAFKKGYIVVLFTLSLLGFVIVGFGSLKENLALFVSITLSFIFLFICLHFCSAVFRRGIWIGLNLDEKICGSVIFIVFMIGASAISVSYFNLASILFPVIILFTTYVSLPSFSIMVSVLSGMALSVFYLNPIYIALSVVIATVSIAFKGNIKLFSALAVELSYIIFVLLFGMGFSTIEIVSHSIGVVIFILLPKKIIDRLSQVFDLSREGMQESMLSRVKGQIEGRLKNLSQVFGEMDKTYRAMVRGVLDDENAIELLKSELIRNVCDNCPDKNNCYRLSNSFLDNSLDMIVSNGYERGKVLLVDLPQYLTSNCSRVNSLIAELNTSLASYKEYVGAISNMDNSRILIAEQLFATSRLLDALSSELSANITFDKRLEERLIEDLRYRGIVCISCAVYQKDISVKEITLIVTNETLDDKNLEKYVSKVMSINMSIVSKEESHIPSAMLVTMVSSPNYDIAFGSSVVKKYGSKSCGDTHSVVKIDEGKYLVSISDGMGSGDRATKISRLTIDLVENFYRAGFESEIILNTVNQLLSLSEDENFATMDLCIIDGRKNTYDFIKLAGCAGYIVHDKGECEVIEGSNLPVGILEDVKPHISKRLITNMDMLVFISDGVEDTLSKHLNIRDYVSSLDIKNPQVLCDTIMERVMLLSDGVAKDDMTVVAVRVFGCN